MQVTVEQRDPCNVELNIEVGVDRVAETIDEVYKEFNKSTNVPGFRRGRAPRQILERYVPAESVRRRAIDLMVPPAYHEALEKEDIHPYAEPDVKIVQLEENQPFVFKAAVPLPPKVELGEYKGIQVERKVEKVTDEDVETHLGYLQESHTTSTKVEGRGVRAGDIVLGSIASALEGEEMSPPKRNILDVGSNVPGFDQGVLGMEPEQRRTFAVEYPKDYPDESLAGKIVNFDVTVEAIRERHIPELNDDFAKTAGDFETLDQLKEDIRVRLAASDEEAADRQVEQEIVGEIVARSKVCFPDVLAGHELGHELEELKYRLDARGLTIDQYLKSTGKTDEDFIAELREAAERRVRIGLVLGEIAEVEKIDVNDEEVDAEIERIATESKATRESVEAYIEARGGRLGLKHSLMNRKLIEYLKSVSTIK